MLKKDTLGAASPKSLSEAYKCGECLHFKAHAHTSHAKPCFDEGVKHFAIAPACFTPDVTQITQNSDSLIAVAGIFAAFNTKQRRIMMAVLKSKPTAKKKLSFGTKVYFRGIGGDYISNYLSGFVMGYTSGGELILSGSPDVKTRGKCYTAYMKDDSQLLTLEEWKVKRRKLKEEGKVNDPDLKFKVKTAVSDYEPPTLDSAPAAWHDKKNTKKRKATSDLTFVIQ